METIFLKTKLFIPSLRSSLVPRPQLIARLNKEQSYKLILLSAPAGYGKTTLVTEWIDQIRANVALCWLSLDEDDSDLQQFFNYLAAAIRPLPDSQSSLLQLLQSPQTLPAKNLMAAFVNDVTPVSTSFLLVLDDYHAIESAEIEQAVAFLLDNMPPQMRLVITSRADPGFPISRLRARDKLIELRADDLRFTEAEAAQFLQQNMNLTLSSAQIAALENRTEGWIAGLQMAALSMQKRDDVTGFIDSFTGSHRFIMDYLLEEVLNQQPAEVQAFLLQTAVLTRLNADLCHAVVGIGADASQQILEQLYSHNIFLTALDDERRWYRYHHLFADLLQQRLFQSDRSSSGVEGKSVSELHNRASVWYEENGLVIEAFHHAAAAKDFERTERLIAGEGVPLYFRGAGLPILNWLESLPASMLDARPSLWVIYASALLTVGQHTAVEPKLQAAEAALAAAALQDVAPDDHTQDLVGRIASMRATLAIMQQDVETMIAQSRQALELLHPGNLLNRMAATWTLGFAYQLQGDRATASQFYTEVMSLSKSLQDSIYTMAAAISLGQLQEADNQLTLAAKTYRRALQLAGDPPQLIACEAYLGLARIHYEWNDLDAAKQHGQQCAQLTQQMESTDTTVLYRVFLARLRLAQGDNSGAAAALDEAEDFIHQHNFGFRMPDVAAAQVLVLLRQEPLLHQGNLAAAAHLAEKHELPISQARVYLAQGDTSAALALLEPLRQQMEAKGWQDEQLKIMILQAIALQAHGEKDKAVQLLDEALALAEPSGFIRIFTDEGLPMAQLLSDAAAQGIQPDYTGKLLAAFETAVPQPNPRPTLPPAAPSHSQVEPLSKRELEILTLIAAGLKSKEIAEQLVISLNTVLYHNKNIYSKLGVHKRTLAIAKAKELNLIES
ncbi:MAG: LuxR C-terminal-related transcriptional regulator [Candidatus Promineifilaceae bacterium]